MISWSIYYFKSPLDLSILYIYSSLENLVALFERSSDCVYAARPGRTRAAASTRHQ